MSARAVRAKKPRTSGSSDPDIVGVPDCPHHSARCRSRAKTSGTALARAFDLAQKLGKKPIVVRDAPGFFTTRVIGETITQGQRMLAEGINPALIENGAAFNGSPMGPLETLDTISLETAYHGLQQRKADAEAELR